MTRTTLPAARAPLVGQGGLTSMPFYRWMEGIDRATNSGSAADDEAQADIAKIAQALGSPDGTVDHIPAQGKQAAINGNGSIVVDGTLSSGAVNITLAYDTQFPDATAYYGSGPDGKRGWFTIASALADSVTIHVDTDPDTGVSAFDLVGFGILTTDSLTEGTTHLYFTKPRVASALSPGAGISLSVDGSGITTISAVSTDTYVELVDENGNVLTDGNGIHLTDNAIAVAVSVFDPTNVWSFL